MFSHQNSFFYIILSLCIVYLVILLNRSNNKENFDVYSNDMQLNGRIKVSGAGLVVGKTSSTATSPGTGVITATDKLCINSTCVTEDFLKRILKTMPPGYTNIVNRRPLFGIGNRQATNPFTGKTPIKLFNSITYGPFGYNVPPVIPGATRKFRMYAVYSDGVTGGAGPIVRVSIFNSAWQEQGLFVDFQFPLTWGGLEESRDAFSNIVDDPKNGMHAMLYTFFPNNSIGNLSVRWQYIELQTLDVF